MSSACVTNIDISSNTFMDCPPAKFPSSYGWLSPRISLSLDLAEDNANAKKTTGEKKHLPSEDHVSGNDGEEVGEEESDPVVSAKEFVDFEFRFDDSVKMLSADELFLDGKLVPLQLSLMRPETSSEDNASSPQVIRSADAPKVCRRDEGTLNDPYSFSPRAPTCSGRWKELLSLKRFYQSSKQQETTPSSTSATAMNSHKSLKIFLNRSSKSSSSSSSAPLDTSLNLPLMKDSDSESISVSSSRLSLSSSCSSSGHEHDDLPRLSLDSDKPNFNRSSNNNNITYRSRVSKVRTVSSENAGSMKTVRGTPARDPEANVVRVSDDSPRMNSSGKIVYNSLERSSSSPSSANGGGHRYHHRGVERSYSGNVRFTPVLNVPVCYLRGSSSSKSSGGVFGIPSFSSTKLKKQGGGDSAVSSSGANGAASNGLPVNRKSKSGRS